MYNQVSKYSYPGAVFELIRASFTKYREWISLLRLSPFNTDTDEGRSQERHRRIFISGLTSAISQVVSLLTVMVSIPLTLQYLGDERYGLWVALTSLITIFGFADFGLGNGLLNAIADSHGRDDRKAATSYVSSTIYPLIAIAFILGIGWLIIYSYIPWEFLFKLKSELAIKELIPSLSTFIFWMLLGLPTGLVQKVYAGYQEGYINGFWKIGGSILGFIGTLVVIYFQAGLPWLVLVVAGSPVLMMCLNSLYLFYIHRPWLMPDLKYVSWSASKKIFKTGSLFFTLQLAAAIAFQTDNLVISHFLGVSSVPSYAVPMKLFMLVPTMLNFGLAPLWPAYGEAFARQDTIWIIKAFIRSLFISAGLSILPSTCLVIFGSRIVKMWIGTDISINWSLLLGFGLWVMLLSLANPISMLLNGLTVIKFQVICAILMAISNIMVSAYLVQKIGIAGPIYGSLISWFIFSLLPSIVYISWLFNNWKLKRENRD